MLVHEWHPTVLLRMVLLSFPQHPRLMVGKRSPAFRFQLFFICVGQSKRIIQNPIPTCACPPVPFDRHSVAEKNTQTIIYWQPYHYHPPIGMGVDRELKPRLSVAELRGLWIENSISFPGLILEAHSAECHYSLFFSSSAKMLSTYLTTRSYSLPLFSLSA